MFYKVGNMVTPQPPGIYAIGDLKEKYARQIVLSAGDGCMAALSAADYVETRKATC
jgi:thioredoxin reductase (NADPH)